MCIMSLEINLNKTESLLNAVNMNETDNLGLLLQSGMDPNIPDSTGRTPLFYAVEKKRDPKMVQLLMQHGAKPHYVMRGLNQINRTPLREACQINSPEYVSILLNIPIKNAKKYLQTYREKIMLAHTNGIRGDFEGTNWK